MSSSQSSRRETDVTQAAPGLSTARLDSDPGKLGAAAYASNFADGTCAHAISHNHTAHRVQLAALVLPLQRHSIVLACCGEVAICVCDSDAAVAINDIELLRIGLECSRRDVTALGRLQASPSLHMDRPCLLL